MSFSGIIINWFSKNGRDLPWRGSKDPYRVWLSEVILQQTRVSQGTPYYERFIQQYPTVSHLANARERSILKLWQGLGYYSRARNMHAAAKKVADIYKGVFPVSYDQLIALPGIGKYTASAISSICGNEARAVLDGNVIRVLSRYFGIRQAIDTPRTLQELGLLAHELLDKRDPGNYNQAIMDFGALHCTPRKPLCGSCPLQSSCLAFSQKLTLILPRKTKKQKIVHRHFHYFLPSGKKFIYMRRRPAGDIWQGLYDLPCIESASPLSPALFTKKLLMELSGVKKSPPIRHISASLKHILSHQVIHARFFEVELGPAKPKNNSYKKIPSEKLGRYPVSRLLDKFLNGG